VGLPALAPEVSGWWAAASAAVQLHPLVRAYLDRARPAAHRGVTLLVVAHTDGEAARLARDAHVLSDALAQASQGAVCEALFLSPPQWRARLADVDATADG
jgi:NADPH-dependent ferric siderophore reductase